MASLDRAPEVGADTQFGGIPIGIEFRHVTTQNEPFIGSHVALCAILILVRMHRPDGRDIPGDRVPPEGPAEVDDSSGAGLRNDFVDVYVYRDRVRIQDQRIPATASDCAE